MDTATVILTKVLLHLVYPLGAALILGAIALVLTFSRWPHMGQTLLGLTLLCLWIASTPIFANWLNFRLESQFPPQSVETLPQSDVVIVLGGVLGQPIPPRVAADLSGSADRIIHALRIYRSGKARFILISAGGYVPWQWAGIPEAQLIADLLLELGVPRSVLILEAESRTTRENAVNTAAIFKEHGWRRGHLVTSGSHMPRALATFQKVGVDVIPASTDIHAGPPQGIILLGLIPSAKSLALTTSAIKEIVGLCVYRYRGWI